ncbi:MAG TPA: hypothetical protein VL984_00595 [Acidimicrobiales bacterium]|nr:hypothetical protein [Acidimicrobiales bacterium]
MSATPGDGGSPGGTPSGGGTHGRARPGTGGPGKSAGKAQRKGAKDGAQDVFKLVVAYAKQETLEPVIAQLKAIGWGLGGAFLFAVGTIFLALGFVRALQGEFGSTQSVHAVTVQLPGGAGAIGSGSSGGFLEARTALLNAPYGAGQHLAGDLSWVPYMGGAVLCVAVAVFALWKIRNGASK